MPPPSTSTAPTGRVSVTFLAPAIRPFRLPRQSQVAKSARTWRACAKSQESGGQSNGIISTAKRVAKAVTAATMLTAALVLPSATHAREKPGVITMTDQVPNFTLPSQEEAVDRSNGNPNRVVVRLIAVAKVAIPCTAVVVVGTWAVVTLVRKTKERQLRDFQVQLSSFSSMLDLDTGVRELSEDVGMVVDNSARIRELAEGKRLPVKRKPTDDNNADDEDAASKVRLNLFQSMGNDAVAGSKESEVQEQDMAAAAELMQAVEQAVATSDLAKVEVKTPFESEVVAAVQLVMEHLDEDGDETVGKGTEMIARAREAAGFSNTEADVVVADVVSRLVSMHMDQAAVSGGEGNEAEGMKRLQTLAQTVSSARLLGVDARMRYVGSEVTDDAGREDLFRRYAMYCLAGERRVDHDLQSLDGMQRMIGVSDERAEAINKEIANGMFQVAVSAAMADGSLSDDDRTALESVKQSFKGYLDGNSADSIMSEVAVMRAMYSLQQLVQEQGVSADDVRQLRQMCKELGVDIDEMLQNADNLGDTLGPEAKNFVDSLRGVLMNASEKDASS